MRGTAPAAAIAAIGIRHGLRDKAEAMDELQEIATAYGIVADVGEDVVTATIEGALKHGPLEETPESVADDPPTMLPRAPPQPPPGSLSCHSSLGNVPTRRLGSPRQTRSVYPLLPPPVKRILSGVDARLRRL